MIEISKLTGEHECCDDKVRSYFADIYLVSVSAVSVTSRNIALINTAKPFLENALFYFC